MTPHLGFIVAAFAVAGVVVAGMVASILWDYHELQTRLARLQQGRDFRADHER